MTWLRRIALLALIAGGLAWPVVDGIRAVRHEHHVRTLLLEVQQALQNYHVDQERYIPRQELNGSQLIRVLDDFGFFDELPLNPWTNEAWRLDDQEPDHLRYRTDPSFETYALQALDAKTGEVLLEIDSVNHPSLKR